MNIHKTNMPRASSPLTLEYILLGIIDQKPMHGYDLHKALSELEGISLIWSIKQSRLYALLDKLETQGYLKSALVPGEAHPLRKEFRLTKEGKRSLKAWIGSPVQHGREMRQDFLARLYFASREGKEKSLHLIRDQERVCQGWLQELEEQVSSLDESHNYEALVYQFRISQTLAMLDWLALCARKFNG